MLVAIFVFVLIVLTSVSVFASIVRSRSNSRKIQSHLEISRAALDQMAKDLRMSTKLDTRNGNASDTRIFMYNNSRGLCIAYSFNTSAGHQQLEMGYADAPDNRDCSSVSFSNFKPITQGDVTNGRFFVTKTESSSPFVIGKATVVMTVDSEKIQTSVSFRDYAGIIQ